MQPEEWQRIKEILAVALELPAAELEPFLAEACGADRALRREVDSLLAAHAEPTNVLEKFSVDLQAHLKGEQPSYDGRRFGPYRILREIGRGGMGAVFLAERADGAFQQQVALKIIRQSVADEELERHFRRERQILASLNHPNIAKLLDGGVSDTGELFLAMEFIAGEPLIAYAEHHHLDIDDRLRLFVKICHAVSFAHQRLIVHRDLKPSNVIVGSDGEPRLLDFGLAKLSEPEETGATRQQDQSQTAFRAFTPAYASPEQILGKSVTTASDVFSLGVILYELLTRDKPFHFEGKSLEEIIKSVTTGEPSLPSRAAAQGDAPGATPERQLKGDLDNITLKALQKDPSRRYQSVADFAGDIERHFAHLPIAARPNTLSYRASRFYQRNRIAVAAAALITVAVIAGLAVALWQYRTARRESATAEAVNAFLQQVLLTGKPGAGRGYQATITDVWQEAEARLERGELGDQPEVRAALRQVVGAGYNAQGNYVAGEKNLRQAHAEQTRLYGAGSARLLNTELELAALFFAKAEYDSAARMYEPMLPLLRAEFEKGKVDAILVCSALNNTALLNRARGNAAQAEALLRECLTVGAGRMPDEQLADPRAFLTLILIDQGKFEEAEAAQQKVVRKHRTAPNTDTPEFCAALTLLGIIEMERGNLADADAHLREAETVYRKLYGPNFIALFDNLRLQAQVAYLAGKYADAEKKIDLVLANYRRNSNPKYISFATALTVQGLTLNRLGRSVEAERVLREAVTLREANLPKEHFMTALTKGALGECLTSQRRYGEAEPLLLESHGSLERSQGAENPRTRLALQRLVTLYEQWGRPGPANEYRRRISGPRA
jgi:eukaryotic-like serine/threonine-protein kinase